MSIWKRAGKGAIPTVPYRNEEHAHEIDVATAPNYHYLTRLSMSNSDGYQINALLDGNQLLALISALIDAHNTQEGYPHAARGWCPPGMTMEEQEELSDLPAYGLGLPSVPLAEVHFCPYECATIPCNLCPQCRGNFQHPHSVHATWQ